MQPNAIQAQVWKGLDLLQLGRTGEALAQLRPLDTVNTVYTSILVTALVQAGLKDEAEKRLAAEEGNPVGLRFVSLAALGRQAEAVQAIDPAPVVIQPIDSVYMNPALDPLRTHPRFVQWLATLGLTEAHARAQAWRAAHPAEKITPPK